MTSPLALAALVWLGPPAQDGHPHQYGDGPSAEEVARLEGRHLTNIRQVTYGFAKAGEGYFHPDGDRILFQAARWHEPRILSPPREGWDDYQIYETALEPGAEPRMVSTGKGKCTCAYYHPNGSSIIYASTHLNPSLGESEPDPASNEPAYSRSERYQWGFDEHMDIFRADPDGSNLQRLTEAPGYDAEGSYSPDGSKIVFTSFRDGNGEIYVMDADGSNLQRITNAPGYDGGPFFSPDGEWIVYRSDRKENDRLQIFLNNVEGTDERQLTDDDHVNWGPYFHPDGRHIAYATSRHGHHNYEIYLHEIETGEETRLTHAPGFDGLPVFSPDGTKLLWTSKGRTDNDTSQLFIADFTLEPAEDGEVGQLDLQSVQDVVP